MRNYIEEYFTQSKNIMNDTIFVSFISQKITPEEFFKMDETEQEHTNIVFEHIVCNDWFKMSVQAWYWKYCEPSGTLFKEHGFFYENMEVWYPSEKVEELMGYSCQEGWEWVYWQVPVNLLNEIIEKHWGIVD